MRIRINYVTPVLAAGVTAMAIAAAPTAVATPMSVTPRTAYGPCEGYHAGHN